MKAKQPIIYVLIISVIIIGGFFVNHKLKQNKLCPDEIIRNRTLEFSPQIGESRDTYIKNGEKMDTSNWDADTRGWVEKNCKMKTSVIS